MVPLYVNPYPSSNGPLLTGMLGTLLASDYTLRATDQSARTQVLGGFPKVLGIDLIFILLQSMGDSGKLC